MKTDYGKLGQESMDSLKATSKQAAAVQACLLSEIMRRNRDTVYGRKYGFGEIETAAEFQKRVPLSVYGDYEDYILQMIAGEEMILTEEPSVYYCISSGTTGEAKYLPLTERDLNIQYVYAYGVPFGMVREYYGDLPEDEVFGKIFQIGEFAKTFMENGVMNGIRSGCLYQWLDRGVQYFPIHWRTYSISKCGLRWRNESFARFTVFSSTGWQVLWIISGGIGKCCSQIWSMGAWTRAYL